MSFGGIALWMLAATVLAGLAFLLHLRGRRQRRLAVEKRRRALRTLAKERQRVALEWRKRDRERARAAEIATQPAAADSAPPVDADLPSAQKQAPPPAVPAAEECEDREERPVRFQVLWHGSIKREEWRPLLVYMYSGWNGLSGARAHFRRRIRAPVDRFSESAAMAVVEHGAPITVIPQLQGFRFDPPAARILWLEQWHCVEFRMQARASLKTLDRMESVQGRVAFFVGPLLIAETAIAVQVIADSGEAKAVLQASHERSDNGAFSKEKSSPAYRAIFLSYSEKDSVIVKELEKAYRAIGDSYLRDVTILRSVEERDPLLLSHIPRADVFQLFWSRAAKDSPYVEREWRCALGLKRRGYIRPVYWELPMPEPPKELRHMNFTFVDLFS